MKERFEKHKRIEGKFGVWNDASKTLPNKDGSYLVILETKSPVERCQSWAGMGKPEITAFYEEWHFKWNGRGTLTVAFWMPLPNFEKKWKKNYDKPGEWV
jgi:hypothetical protein